MEQGMARAQRIKSSPSEVFPLLLNVVEMLAVLSGFKYSMASEILSTQTRASARYMWPKYLSIHKRPRLYLLSVNGRS